MPIQSFGRGANKNGKVSNMREFLVLAFSICRENCCVNAQNPFPILVWIFTSGKATLFT